MNEKQFLDWCKDEIVKYTNSHLDKSDKKEITNMPAKISNIYPPIFLILDLLS